MALKLFTGDDQNSCQEITIFMEKYQHKQGQNFIRKTPQSYRQRFHVKIYTKKPV